MINESLQDKIWRGVKVDTSLHVLEREIQLERESKGLPPEARSANPEKVFAEWRRKHAVAKASVGNKISSRQAQDSIRELSILIAPAPAHGYWAYCPAVNGKRWHGETMAAAEKKLAAYLKSHLDKLAAQSKPLPKTNGRVKKIKIAAAR